MASKKTSQSRSATQIRAQTHGPVHNWLFRHRRSILAIADREGCIPSWEPFLRRMAEAGVTRPSGKPLTTEVVRWTWHKLLVGLAREESQSRASPLVAKVRRRGPAPEPPSRPGQNAPVRVPAAPAVAAPPPAAAPATADHQATAPPLKPYQMTGKEKLARLQQQARDLSPKLPVPKFSGPLE